MSKHKAIEEAEKDILSLSKDSLHLWRRTFPAACKDSGKLTFCDRILEVKRRKDADTRRIAALQQCLVCSLMLLGSHCDCITSRADGAMHLQTFSELYMMCRLCHNQCCGPSTACLPDLTLLQIHGLSESCDPVPEADCAERDIHESHGRGPC